MVVTLLCLELKSALGGWGWGREVLLKTFPEIPYLLD